uniref:Receptor-like serine/threonine-protein kinase n=1 Tax=Fagus sylvatica TaxID=28930 RepID=A0A2N9I632_FAGSY
MVVLSFFFLSFPQFSPTVKKTVTTVESPLLAQKESNSWTSPSGEFAFGFHPFQNSEKENHFLLAVWFDKIKEKTIVWSANGNEPAPQGSELKQTSNSEFVLNDDKGNELWKASSNGSKSICAAILDSGNLVILDEQYNSIWESFKEPTDTILPGQILRMPSTLRSRQSETNYSEGRFQLSLQTDGNLALYSLSMPSGIPELHKAGYMYIDGGIEWVYNLTKEDPGSTKTFERVYNLTKEDPGSTKTFYHIARIDYDGIFRLYKHLRNDDTTSTSGGSCPASSWTEVQAIPDDICDAGFCGPNSICGENTRKVGKYCSCPPEFSPVFQSGYWAGCKPNFALPSCHDGLEAKEGLVDFVRFTNVDWPDSNYDSYGGEGVDEASCGQQCLDDCLCFAALYAVQRKRLVGSCVLLGSSAFLNILLFLVSSAAVYYLYHKKLNLPWNIDRTFATNVRRYTYKELEEATRGFKQILGKGAFGTVYKGVLASDSRRFVAIKKLDKVVEEGEKEFTTEVSVIGQTHHKNLVRLLGYCDEEQHRLLVYEYMSNGSLASFLFGISRPHWNQRVQIAFGIARGLMYLHEECSTQIIHCDIKPQNILLDEYYTPRIADFGLAKLLLAEQTRAARTGIRGTIGYFAPEWFRKASISVKVDVYSFGVMLLEIICCKSSVAFAMGEEEALIDWAYECYKDKKLEKLIENDEEARNDKKRLERFVIVAIWCIQEDPSLRPSMKKITQMLEEVIEVSVPPRPSFYASSPPSNISSLSFHCPQTHSCEL